MQHAYTTPDYPPHWDDDADPVEYSMTFAYKGEYYRVWGEWTGADWTCLTKAYILNDEGAEEDQVFADFRNHQDFWVAASGAAVSGTYEDMEVVR